MKRTLRLALLATALSLTAMQAGADQTNLVRSLTIQLVGLKQGDSSTTRNTTTTTLDRARVDTRDVIDAISAVTSVQFSPQAQLVVITPLPDGAPMVAIRDAGTSTDVSPFFGFEKVSEAVSRSTANTKTGKYTGSSYSIQRFALQDFLAYGALSLHYNVSGIAVETFSNTAYPGPRDELEVDVSGAGDSAGQLLILQGTIHLRGYTLEVVPDGGGQPT
jgi:hypothetical protein